MRNQTLQVNDRILISGQIGLIPSCLTLPSPPSLAIETALSFQHVERVTNALKTNTGGGWNGYAQAVLYWIAKSSDIIHVKQASMEYEKAGTRLWLGARFTLSLLPHRMLVYRHYLSL
jgi:diphthine-ammonia ligase